MVRLRLSEFNSNQSGAIAMLTMAALLVLTMIAWVLFDAGTSARDALDVQASADTASWSQSAVEARSMNMMAFANVGKRVTFGMTSFYQALWLSWAALLVAAAALTVACWIANIPLFGAITSVCKELTSFTIQVGLVMVDELPDLIIFESDLVQNYFKDDLTAFDDYQKYMTQLTPWWSWAEGFTRGARNGAMVASSFPVPEKIDLLPSMQTDQVDRLPVEKAPTTQGYTDMCAKVYSELDIIVHVVDYGIKSSGNMSGGSGWERPLAFLLTGGMALGFMIPACAINALIYGDVGAPYQMETFSSDAMWQLRASNLTFSYAPNPKRFSDTGDRKKYNYLSPDYTSWDHYTGGGYYGMARSEISFQDGTPDLWKASWTARMRPVALPGEWSSLGSGVTLVKAWRDVLPYVHAASAVLSLVDGAISGDLDPMSLLEGEAKDLVNVDSALGGLTDDSVEGLAK